MHQAIPEPPALKIFEKDVLFDSIPVGLAVFDRHMNVVRVNERLASLNGLCLDAHSVLRMDEVMPPDAASILSAGVTSLMAGTEIPVFKSTFHHPPTREKRTWLISYRPLRGSGGKVDFVLGTVFDITEFGDAKVEAQLAEREAQLALFVENAPAAIAMFDREMRYLAFSRRFIEDYGLPKDFSLIGRSHYEVFPEIPQRWRIVHARVLAGEELDADEEPFPRANGRTEWVRWSMKPWRHAGGKIGGAMLFTEVITERVEARRALAESEERFRALADNIAQIAWITNREGKITWFNRRANDFSGMSLDELAGTGWTKLLQNSHSERVLAKIAEAVQGGTYWEDTLPLRGADGTYRWFLSRAWPIGSGEVLQWFGTCTDITELHDAQEALVQTQERERRKREELEAILAAIPAAVLIAEDAACTTMTANLQGYELLRLPPQANVSKSAPAEQAPKNFEVFRDGHPLSSEELPIQRAVSTKSEILGAEFELRFEEGDSKNVLGNALPLFDDNGEVRGAVGAFLDITDRKRIEERLIESRRDLDRAQAVARTGNWRLDVNRNELTWSAETFRIFGISPKTPLRYENFLAAVHPDDREYVDRSWKSALSGAPYDIEHRIIAGNMTKWVRERAALEFDAAGRLLGGFGTVQDITDTKRAEERLRMSEERFRGIFEHAGTGIAISDLEGRFQSCNRAFYAMLGYTEAELRELTIADIQHPDDCDANLENVRRLVTEKVPSFEIASRYLNKDGKTIWVHKRVSLLRDGAGKPTSIIALVTDITERKRHEEQIGLLLREVNHRAKNMLALVQAIARQTVANNPGDFVERFGERVRALAASQDLLVKSAWKGVDLDELIRSQLAHFKDLIGSRIEFKGPPLFICASAAQTIGMAMHELATNAGKYGALSSREGRVEIDWRVARSEGGEEKFVMSWREREGPPVKSPAKTGFGSIVIDQMANMSLDAEVGLDYAPGGLVWRLECPSQKVLQASAPPQPPRP